jgi:hypothetical protein
MENNKTMKTESNATLVPCDAITAPVDDNAPAAFDDFVKWHRQMDWPAHVRKPLDIDVLGKMQQMRDHCDKLERMNEELKRFAKAIHSFMKDKKIYMEKGTSCGYMMGFPVVYSTACLECDSCLGVIEGCGVICQQVLYGVKVSSVKRARP